MKVRTVFMVALIVLSGTIAWAGGSAVAVDQSETSFAVDSVNEAVSTNDSTPSDDGGSTEYKPIDKQPPDAKNVSIDWSSMPAQVGQTQQEFQTADTSPEVGTTKVFPQYNYKTGEYFFENFTLRAYSEHGAIWVANNLSWGTDDPREAPTISDAQVEYLMEEFKNNVYPTETKLFGTPDKHYGTDAILSGPPGEKGRVPDNYYQTSDNESRVVVLVDNIRDKNYYNESYPLFIAGYSSTRIEQFTDRNVVTVDGAEWDNRLGPLDAPWRPKNASENAHSVEGTLAHEYQHLLHSDHDRNEKSWINEGMSDFTEYAVGYGLPATHVQAFEQHPENSLVIWGDQGEINILADYGKAGLFQLYLK